MESASSLGERLSLFYEFYGLKRPEFAKRMNIPYDRLNSYLQDRAEPPGTFWKKLREEFPNTDIGFIITGVPGLEKPEYISNNDLEKIPILGTIGAGSLSFGFKDEEVIDWTWTTKVKDPKAFGLIVRGDSMLPQIHDGDYVLCSPSRAFVNGKIYAVVARDSEHTVKTVFKEKDGYRLIPVNPEFQTDFVKDQDMIKLIRVVQVISFDE